ncbi:MAG: type II toxin-antitoxin system VapC family toxin [Acidobacteria bacterium]|nr:type II toxin-antitoxin system VapC family toxin [Acidobacteriota bacterium]
MKRLVLDTHVWVWSALDSSRLTAVARAAILDADAVHVSPISLYEVTQKARLGKWPEIAPHIDALVAESETLPAPLTRAVAARAGMLDWVHRDPFDRFIAASALELRCRLVSKDDEFDALEGMPGWQGRIWA